MAERIKHLEVARGLGIMLVVMGHSYLFSRGSPVPHHVVHSINMPMFFLMSGVLFRSSKSLSTVFFEKLDGVLKPFFVTLLLVAPLQPFLSHEPFSQYVAGSLYGTGGSLRWTPLWFLPHLFLVFITAKSYLIVAAHLHISTRMSFMLGACSITGTYFIFKTCGPLLLPFTGVKYGPELPIYSELGLPFSADLLLITVPIFLIGHALQDTLRVFTPRRVLVVGALAFFCALHYLGKGELNLSDRVFDDFLVNIAQTVCGVYLVLSFAVWVAHHAPVLRFTFTQVGIASLFILLFHDFLQRRSYRFFVEHDLSFLLAGSLAYAVAIVVPVLFYRGVVRVPWLAMLWLPIKRVRRMQQAQTAPEPVASGTPFPE